MLVNLWPGGGSRVTASNKAVCQDSWTEKDINPIWSNAKARRVKASRKRSSPRTSHSSSACFLEILSPP